MCIVMNVLDFVIKKCIDNWILFTDDMVSCPLCRNIKLTVFWDYFTKFRNFITNL